MCLLGPSLPSCEHFNSTLGSNAMAYVDGVLCNMTLEEERRKRRWEGRKRRREGEREVGRKEGVSFVGQMSHMLCLGSLLRVSHGWNEGVGLLPSPLELRSSSKLFLLLAEFSSLWFLVQDPYFLIVLDWEVTSAYCGRSLVLARGPLHSQISYSKLNSSCASDLSSATGLRKLCF